MPSPGTTRAGFSARRLRNFLLQLQFLLLEICDEEAVRRRAGIFVTDAGFEPGMFGVQCGNMGCVQILSSLAVSTSGR